MTSPPRWVTAQDWNELHESIREFIVLSAEGRKDITTFNHGGPLDPESMPLVPGLLRLLDLGIMTLGSQPAEQSFTHKDDGTPDGIWCQKRQLPYLELALPTRGQKTQRFIDRLLNDRRLNTCFFYSGSEGLISRSSHPEDEIARVTVHRSARDKDNLAYEEWKQQTTMPTWALRMVSDTFFNVPNILEREDIHYVLVWPKFDIDFILTAPDDAFWCQASGIDIIQMVENHARQILAANSPYWRSMLARS